MQPHHIAWLSAHPDRTEAWLRERMRDGFDVHHLDGDHGNNDSGNLVLIEHADHMRLHGMTGRKLRTVVRTGPRAETLEKGKMAYGHRANGMTWRAIASKMGTGRKVMLSAKVFAQVNGLAWPPIG